MREFMGSFCRKITPIFSLLLSLAVAALWSASAYAAPIANGTVMASIGNGIVTEFDQNGTPLNQINTTKGSLIFTTGSVFDSSGNLLRNEREYLLVLFCKADTLVIALDH